MTENILNELTGNIIGIAIEVHRELSDLRFYTALRYKQSI
jgi:hypothetical protein